MIRSDTAGGLGIGWSVLLFLILGLEFPLNASDAANLQKVSLTKAGPFFLVSVTVNSVQGRLILDTGSTGSVIAEDRLEALGIKAVEGTENDRGVGSTEFVTYRQIVIPSLKLGALTQTDMPAVTMSLDDITAGLPKDVMGILGRDYLVRAKAVLALGEAALYQPAPGYQNKLPKHGVTVPLTTLDNGFMVVEAEIEDQTCRLLIDSGAPDVVLHHAFATKLPGGAQLKTEDAVPGRLHLGPQHFPKRDLIVTDLSHFVAAVQEQADIRMDGLLGLAFLEHHQALLDAPNSRLLFPK